MPQREQNVNVYLFFNVDVSDSWFWWWIINFIVLTTKTECSFLLFPFLEGNMGRLCTFLTFSSRAFYRNLVQCLWFGFSGTTALLSPPVPCKLETFSRKITFTNFSIRQIIYHYQFILINRKYYIFPDEIFPNILIGMDARPILTCMVQYHAKLSSVLWI